MVIAVGLLILWLAVTGKLGNIEAAWRALVSPTDLIVDLEKAKIGTPPLDLPPLGAAGAIDRGIQAAGSFNIPLPFPALPSFN